MGKTLGFCANVFVEAKNVTFTYRGAKKCSLKNVCMEAHAGEVTLLCGASGSGKTTALRLFNGLIPHFHDGELRGSVSLGKLEVPATDLHTLAGYCSTVFQNPRTQFYTTQVDQELAFGSENLGRDPELIVDRVHEVAAQLGMESFLGFRLGQLSGGQMQRVACGAAMCTGAPVILFDEPSANLSLDAIDKLRELIVSLKASGHTVVIAEHRLWFLAGVADRVYFFNQGEVAGVWSGEDFFSLDESVRRDLGLRSLCSVESVDKEIPSGGGLTVDNLKFGYRRGQEVLNLDHLLFPSGKVTALMGANGVGKTTLARLICGLEKTRQGSICLNGSRLRALDAYIVMQDPTRQLFSDTVRGEVTLGIPLKNRCEVDERQILQHLDLWEHEDAHPQSLSGGQRQRLVVATALASRKSVYIFDEPTSGVGYQHLLTISGVMRKLAESGAVVIVITHDQELVNEVADHVVHLG